MQGLRCQLYKYCEDAGLKYIIGLIRNEVLKRMTEGILETSHTQYQETQKKQRLFTDGKYQAQSWDRERRVIMKAKWFPQGPNSRFVVTNLSMDTQQVYE